MAHEKGGRYAVFGNLAYDFRNTETYPCEEYSLLPEEANRPAKKMKTVPFPKRGRGISLMALIGTPIATMLLVCGIMAQIHLVAIADQTVELTESIEQLKEEGRRLSIEYAMSFDLAELELYARNELGMRRPSADQIHYIDFSEPDAGLTEKDENGIFASAKEAFDRIGEYFS